MKSCIQIPSWSCLVLRTALLLGVIAAGERTIFSQASVHQFTAPTAAVAAGFGGAVAADGDRVVIGAIGDRTVTGEQRGAAYVFRKESSKWVFEARLEGTSQTEAFGTSVAIQGDLIVIGSPYEWIDGIRGRGAVYIFRRNANNDWTLEKRIARPEQTQNLRLGQSVAIDGDTIAATMWPTVNATGSIHIFRRVNDDWVDEAILRDETGIYSNGIGLNVDISGNTVVAGEQFGQSTKGVEGGAVIVFIRSGSTWTMQARIPGPVPADTRFGTSTSIVADRLIVGAPSDEQNEPLAFRGAVHIYSRQGGEWVWKQKLRGFGAEGWQGFGTALDASGDRLVVGAPSATFGTGGEPGAAYFFRREGEVWVNGGRLIATDTHFSNTYGTSVAIAGNRYFSGSPTRIISGLNQSGGVDLFIEPPGIPDLTSASDSGTSSTDDLTNADNLSFTVSGAATGASLELLRNGQVVASGIAGSGPTTLTDLSPPSGATYKYSSRQTVNGEVSSSSDLLGVTVDRSSPSVEVNHAGVGGPTRESSVTFFAVPSEPAFGLDASDVSLAESTANVANAIVEFLPDTTPLAFRVSGMVSDGQFVRATMPSGSFTDAAGNPNNASTSTNNTIIVDNVRPSVTIDQADGQADPTGTLPIRYKVVFSEPVTDFTASDVSFAGTANMTGRQVTVTGGGSLYEVAVTGFSTNGQTVIASIGNARVDDALGNRNFPSTSTDNVITVDNVGPTVTINQSTGQSDPTSLFPVRYTVTFNEAVTGFSLDDLSFAGSTVATTDASIVITGSGSTYGVEVSNVGGGGILRVSVLAGAVADAFSNPSTASASSDNSVRIIPPFATISGRVTTTQGRGVRMVRIVVTLPDGSKRYFRAQDTGYFTLRDIPTGRITLTLTRKPNRNLTQSFDLLEDQSDIQFVF